MLTIEEQVMAGCGLQLNSQLLLVCSTGSAVEVCCGSAPSTCSQTLVMSHIMFFTAQCQLYWKTQQADGNAWLQDGVLVALMSR